MAGSDDPLWRVVYVSRAAERFDRAALDDLLDQSRDHNRTVGITGVLLHIEDRFLQVIEGGCAAVEQLYGRIQDDPRHHEVTTLIAGPLDDRLFGDWSMAALDGDAAAVLDVAALEELVAGFAGDEASGPEPVLGLLLAFRQQLIPPA